jgi:hypothetical protein
MPNKERQPQAPLRSRHPKGGTHAPTKARGNGGKPSPNPSETTRGSARASTPEKARPTAPAAARARSETSPPAKARGTSKRSDAGGRGDAAFAGDLLKTMRRDEQRRRVDMQRPNSGAAPAPTRSRTPSRGGESREAMPADAEPWLLARALKRAVGLTVRHTLHASRSRPLTFLACAIFAGFSVGQLLKRV